MMTTAPQHTETERWGVEISSLASALSRDQTSLGRNFFRSDVSTREVWNIRLSVYIAEQLLRCGSPLIKRNFWYYD
jgi:hypothetical protein